MVTAFGMVAVVLAVTLQPCRGGGGVSPTDLCFGEKHFVNRELATTKGLVSRQNENLWKEFTKAVKTGTDIANTLLTVAKWPLVVSNILHASALSQIGNLIALFNFFVSFVTPGGMGTQFLAWLRDDPPMKMRAAFTSWAEVLLTNLLVVFGL